MNAKPRPGRDASKEACAVKSKFLREIGCKIGKAQTSCAVRRVGLRSSLPEFGGDVLRQPRPAKGFRAQGSQTERVDEYDGVVRYPSGRRVEEAREKKEVGLQVENTSPRGWGGGEGAVRRTPVDHVRANLSVPTIKPQLAPVKKADPLRAPNTYQRGIIPKYLQKLKEESEKNESHARQLSLENSLLRDADLIEKTEKLKRITSWHESYKKMVSELNTLSASN